ncbi:MAG: RidA family protein [Streptosporangiales bacterium]|nr:RidA family protein [Streptosporangiales bacterium]
MQALGFVNPEGAPPPVGQYTNVSIVGAGAATAYVAGQLAVDETGALVAPGDFDAQADAVFAGLATLLESLGSSLKEVAFVRAFLVRDEDFVGWRDARRRAFAEHGVLEPPPATTVVVSGLYGGALIELDAVAVLASGS